MNVRFSLIVAIAVYFLAGCDSPKDIVLGPDPLKQLTEQQDQLKKLSLEDRKLLVSYLAVQSIGTAFAGGVSPATGKTVGEVLKEAETWREEKAAQALIEEKRAKEAQLLRQKVEVEARRIAEQLAGMVTIAVTDKVVLPKDYDVGRFSEMLMIKYALHNKSEKGIRQIKGRVFFTDATGDPVGDLSVDFDENIAPGQTIKTDTGIGWRLNGFSRGAIEKIAERDFNRMTGKFTIASVAFSDGSVIKAPEIE